MNLFKTILFRSIALAFLLSAFLSLNLQAAEFIKGEVLVQITRQASIEQIAMDLQIIDGTHTELKVKKSVSSPLDIWLLQFDSNKINHRNVLNALSNHPQVLIAQNNHVIEYRATTPNDDQFEDQWQYINDGSNGGTVGADIDMELAWDYTTGGTTVLGDEIVVCVVDDGADLDHTDWGDNLWENLGEIPGNNIDDDNNGYIDDYLGWNADFDNDDISGGVFGGGGHGTPVAGIIGAQGNNDNGVAGVNWDVKLMIVVGGGNEAQAIEAYTYPYTMRQLYNETNGAEGAFVVSTNSSWGIDGGQPEDSPLWCNFYDTMGEVGIVNCGATINGNQNVDTFGDLPTACSSDYLISVTNMNRNDVKVTGAGYGLETIDLGAFGQDTWTMAFGGGYGGFGGTSGATPHVAGTVGLCYAAPCNGLIELAKDDPGAAALLVKQYILDGVDPNASLQGITTTGGRLNVNNTMELIVGNCGNCSIAFGVETAAATDVEANVVWETIGNAPDLFEYSVLLDGETIATGETIDPNITITDLAACTDYVLEIQSMCAEEESGVSVYEFRTDGCCELPSEYEFVVSEEGLGQLMVSNVLAATGYVLEYRLEEGGEWITETLTGNVFTFPELEECALYEYRLQTFCGDQETGFSAVQEFVADCGSCSAFEYCGGEGGTSEEFINSVAIDGNLSFTGDNGGYAFFPGVLQTLNIGCEYSIALAPGFSGNDFPEVFTVFIDMNQDGLFSVEELILETEPSNSLAQDMIVIPEMAMPGVTRMRIKMQWADNADTEACGDYEFGEVEDYCLRLESSGSNEEVTVAITELPTGMTICPGGEIQLEAVATEGVTYDWYPSVSLSDDEIANPIASPNSTTTYTLTVTKEGACEEIIATDQIVVEVVEADIALDILEGTSICEEGETELGITFNGEAEITWSPAESLSDANAQNPIANPTETTTYTVVLSQEINGCLFEETEEVTIEVVSDNLELSLMNVEPICSGTNVQLNAMISEDATVTWFPTDGLSDPNSAQPTANLNTTTTYVVTATQIVGECIIEKTEEMTIEVSDIPIAASSTELPDNGCEDNVWRLNAEPSIGNNLSYEWTTEDGNFVGGTNEANVLISSLGTYTIMVINEADCASEFDVVIDNLPTVTGADAYVVDGDLLLGPAGFFTYQWFKNGEAIEGATEQNYTIESSGDYSLAVTNDFGCSAETALQNITFSGIEQLDLNAIQVSPNPTNGLIQIDYQAINKVEAIQVFNVKGQLMYSVQNEMPQSLDLSQEANGLYLIEILTEEGLWNQRVLKF